MGQVILGDRVMNFKRRITLFRYRDRNAERGLFEITKGILPMGAVIKGEIQCDIRLAGMNGDWDVRGFRCQGDRNRGGLKNRRVIGR